MSSAREKRAQEEHFRKPTSPPSSGLFAPPDSSPQSEVMNPGEERDRQQPQPDGEIHNKEDTKSEGNPPPTDWKYYKVSVKDKIPEDEVILWAGDKVLLSRGNIGTTSGKAKSCKTFLTSAMAGACIAGEYLGMTTTLQNLKVLLVDTEQGKSRAQKVQKRIHRMCGLSPDEESDRLTVISVREIAPAERLDKMKQAMAEVRPDFVVLDGVRDLLLNFNELDQCTELVNVLMALSTEYKCGIMTVIHQNKADVNARGHLGSELMNKSETALEVRRADKISTVSHVHCRNEEFDDFSFRINEKVLPELCDTPVKKKDKKAELKELFFKAMFGTSRMMKKDLEEKIAAMLNRSTKTGERRIKEAIAANILEDLSDGSVCLVTELVDGEDDEDDGLPF